MSKWISVKSKKKPRVYIDIVLVGRNKNVRGCMPASYINGQFIAIDGFNTIADRKVYAEPTHWMPLPEPPK